MKKIKERMPFIAFVCLLMFLGALIVIPASLIAEVGGIDKCRSGECQCFCPDDLCYCGAGFGGCYCRCTEPRFDVECPDNEGGSGGIIIDPPYWY